MKVLHLNQGDMQGGAARAAYRIHHALAGSGVDSRMRVMQRGAGDERVVAVAQRPSGRILRKLLRGWLAFRSRNWRTDNLSCHSFGEVGAGLAGELNASNADVLNLHWVSDMLSISDIGRLKKPIVWTLHDMWAFCGGEHYAADGDTARFRQGYFADNRPTGERGPDLNRRAWERKRRMWAEQRFTLVSPSRWLAGCARQSMLCAAAPVYVIPNPLDTEKTWRPFGRSVARAALDLPPDRKLVMFGAHGGTADPRKGGDLLHEAAARIAARTSGEFALLIYGQDRDAGGSGWPCRVHWLGPVRDDRLLALAYSAADVMIVPSRQDNLPNTAVEAQACGTPVAAFDIGGLPDIVIHGETGWLARPFDIDELAEGVSRLLTDEAHRAALSAKARLRAVELFAEPVVARQYLSVYGQVLAAAAGRP